ncbi:F0F1 ATP synthase subunit A [bacterium]|nr:F0F1 ATP synthase subunit A [bacterium]
MEHHPHTWFHFIPGVNHHNVHMITTSFVVLMLVAGSLIIYPRLKVAQANLIPDKKFNLKTFFELLVEVLAGLSKDVIGPNHYKYLPFVGTIFMFIFFSNLIGMIPGFLPPTENWATGAAVAIISFIAYNYFGFAEQGPAYVKHFMAPLSLKGVKNIFAFGILFILLVGFQVFFIGVELIGNVLRPITLSIRLFANITADHQLLGSFIELFEWGLPIPFMILGIFVSFMQAFIFTLLSMVYISMAVSHDH